MKVLIVYSWVSAATFLVIVVVAKGYFWKYIFLETLFHNRQPT